MKRWNILYRGSLSSCNYSCSYCPFAKTTNTNSELETDRFALERFVDWVAEQTHRRIGVLMTPWGEALIHAYYRKALVLLSQMPHVYRAAIQTNLSGNLDSLQEARTDTLAIWATWHPQEVSMQRFLTQCARLDAMRVAYSVGVVGLKENLPAIEAMRTQLADDIYLWVNAYKCESNYYDDANLKQIRQIDPYFDLNNQVYSSFGKSCLAGEKSFTVDAEGSARRCHFIDQVIGNIYQKDFEICLKTRICSNETCRCYIGYIHRPQLELESLYGDGLLSRIPHDWPNLDRKYLTIPG